MKEKQRDGERGTTGSCDSLKSPDPVHGVRFKMAPRRHRERSRHRHVLASAMDGRLELLQFLSFFFKDLLYLYKYIVAVFRREHQIPLQMVVSHHVVAGSSTQHL